MKMPPTMGELSRAKTANALVRAAYVAAWGIASGNSDFGDAFPAPYNDDAVVQRLLNPPKTRAATTLTTTTSAPDLAGLAVTGFVESLSPLSAAVRLFALGARVSMAGSQLLAIPRRSGLPSSSRAWIAEGAPHPVIQYSLEAASMGPVRKLQFGAVLSRETVMVGGEPVVALLLREDASASLDASVFDASAASATRPAGLLNGISPTAGAAGGGSAAMLADLGTLSAAVVALGGSDVTYVANPTQALAARLYLMSAANPPVILSSPGVPAGTVIAVDPRVIVSAIGGIPKIKASIEGAVQLEGTTPRAIVDGSSTPAPNTRSLWQTDAISLRCTINATWAMRLSAIAAVDNVTW
jgi:hypothetical protein